MHAQDSAHPTGISHSNPEGKQDSVTIRARNRKANAAIQMRLAKAGWDEIAEVLGFPTERACKVAVERALEKEFHEQDRTVLRNMASKQLDRLLRAIWAKAIDPEHPEQMAAQAMARGHIADHRKLWGLDAPTEVTVHSATAAEIEAWVARVSPGPAGELAEADIFDEGDIIDGEVVEEG